MLQDDPDLPGVAMIIFDEFHERSIHADLGLALSLDVQKHLRSDLRILIMSATLEGTRLTTMLGNVPFVESRGKLFPVDTRYARFPSDKHLETRVADTVERAIQNDEGDILVFLPGWREIQRTEQTLFERHLNEEIIVSTLHGEAAPATQAEALAAAPAGKRKVILSTNVAETSLTIEGVRVVVDSGLARVSRFDPRRGMSGLVTVPIPRSSADQRRGRAGRLAPGVCYRLWTEQEHEQRSAHGQPEIKSSDLANLALELARWGTPDGHDLVFLDPPPHANLQQAQQILYQLEALDTDGKLTTIGRAMADLPVHPRLAHMILRAKSLGLGEMACEIAALLEERDLFTGHKDTDVDLTTRWHALGTKKGVVPDRIATQARRLKFLAKVDDGRSKADSIGLLLAFSYPDRIGKRRDKSGGAYVLSGGTTASLPAGSTLSRHEFLAVADADTVGTGIRIYLCAPIAKQQLVESFRSGITSEEVVRWDSAEQCVDARRVTRLGALTLSESPLPPDDDRILDAMAEGVRQLGLHALPWDKDSRAFCDRSEWLRSNQLVGEQWPTLDEKSLLESLGTWLKPFLLGIRQRNQLGRVDLASALRSLFTYAQLKDLERLAPDKMKLPSGSLCAVEYKSGTGPVLAVRLQELFGQIETPKVGAGKIPVVIHLLSPARRPLAVTSDLPSFWKNAYPELLGQMRAKYPKHVWPDDPLHARPTGKTKRQLERTG